MLASQPLVPDIEDARPCAPPAERVFMSSQIDPAQVSAALAIPKGSPMPALVASHDNSPDHLIAFALREKMPIDYLRELFALKKEVDAHRAQAEYNDAVSSFAAEAIVVLKNKHVKFPTKDQTGRQTGSVDYWHAELADVVEAVAPALARYGLSYRWDTKFERGEITVTCILRHRLGHSESVVMTGPRDDSGKKNILQQQQSTVTYLQRHSLKAITGVAEKGDDDDGRGGPSNSGPADEFKRDLGSRAGEATGETVQAAEGEREKLIQTGEDKALGGMGELAPWWKGISERERKLIGGAYGPLKAAAGVVDRDRAAGKGLHDEARP